MSNFKIDKDIPVPTPKADSAVYSKLAKSMDAGDSVLCETKNQAQALATQIRNLDGFTAVTRTQTNDMVRVWKVKNGK